VSLVPFMRCEGWQTQQLTKLALSRYLDCKRYVILDSDVVICANPDFALFGTGDNSVVFEKWLQPAQATRQQRTWHATAESFFEGASRCPASKARSTVMSARPTCSTARRCWRC